MVSLRTVFIKIGGSFITFKDKPFSIDYSALENTYKILFRVYKSKKLVVGHGGGSFAHPIVNAMREGDPCKAIVLCQKATRLLNNLFVNYLVDNGLPMVSIQTSMLVYLSRDGYRVNVEPIHYALNNGLVPVVYGECIYSEEGVYKVLSTEELFKILVPLLKPERIVFIERVGGVYDRDPIVYRDARLIPLINRENYREITSLSSRVYGVDVTGGMKSKIELCIELARDYGVDSIIVSGYNIDDCIKAVVNGKPSRGTIITW